MNVLCSPLKSCVASCLHGDAASGLTPDFSADFDNAALTGFTFTRASDAEGQPTQDSYYSTFSSGAPRVSCHLPGSSVSGLHLEAAARTNLVTRSYDLSNAAWTKSITSAALDETGLDGGTTASTITESDGAAGGFLQIITAITSNTNVNIGVIYVKKDADTSRYPSINLYSAFGTSDARFILNTVTGATTSIFGSGWVVREVSVGGIAWWRIVIPVTNDSRTSIRWRLWPAYSTDGTSFSNAATGSCVIGNVEFYETGTTSQATALAQFDRSSPIFTAGATVTQAADALSRDLASRGVSDSAGTVVAGFAAFGFAGTSPQLLRFGGTPGIDAASAPTLQSKDGTNSTTTQAPTLDGTEQTVSVAWGSNLTQELNGTATAGATYDGSMGAEANALTLANALVGPIVFSKLDEYATEESGLTA